LERGCQAREKNANGAKRGKNATAAKRGKNEAALIALSSLIMLHVCQD